MSLGHRTNHILLLIAAFWLAECASVIRRVTRRTSLVPDNEKSRWVVTPPDIKRRWEGTRPPLIKVEEDDGDPKDWNAFWVSMMNISENMAALPPVGDKWQTARGCFIISTTYTSALQDFRKYFTMRYFYENNLEYEVGYLTSEIVTKYQRMLEIYYIAEKRYFRHQDRNFLPPTYMVYLYTSVLEMGTVLGHLCNMLTELEEKFKTVNQTGFDDYNPEKKINFNRKELIEKQREMSIYQKMLQQAKKKRLKAIKKLRKKKKNLGYMPTTPPRKPTRGKRLWPIHYGWSIENWPPHGRK